MSMQFVLCTAYLLFFMFMNTIWKLHLPTFCLKYAHHILFILDIASLHKSCQVNQMYFILHWSNINLAIYTYV